MNKKENQKRSGKMLFLMIFVSCIFFILKSDSLKVNAAESKIWLSKSSVTIEKGKEFTLKLKGVKKGIEIKWSVSGKAAAVTMKKGNMCKITGMEAGKVMIFADCDGKTYKCKVKVKLPPPALSEKTVNIKHGERTYIVLENTSKPVKWSVKNPEIVDIRFIRQYCIMIGKRAGTTYVTAQMGGKTYHCKVTVSESGKPEVMVKKIALTVGHTVRLPIRDTGHKIIKWGTENPEIVSVDKYGTIKAKKSGSAKVFAVTADKTIYARIVVFEDKIKENG